MSTMRLANLTFACLIAVCFCSVARADGLLYTFSGRNGLSGTFSLGVAAPTSTNCDALGCNYQFSSASNSISGNYGAYSFSGTSRLDVFDLLPPGSVCCNDAWTVRGGNPVLAALTGNVVNGRSVTGVNLFISCSPGCATLLSGAPLAPPNVDSPNQFNFGYNVIFSDFSLETGALNSVVLVPEPSTLALLSSVLLALPFLRRKRK